MRPTTILALALLLAAAVRPAAAADISGAGATFPYPVYAKWADAYKRATGIGMNYQSIGSGAGVKQIVSRTVTFGATDAPMRGPDLERHGLVQFPTVLGAIVPIVNIDGIAPGRLVLDGPVIARIYLGEIKNWNDPAIVKLNPDLKLPSRPILPVRRSDGSGTTFNLTHYLARVSPEFRDKVGVGTAVEWPVGLGAKGNEGVANNVLRMKGTIGYVEHAFAKQNTIAYARMVNREGKVVAPETKSFVAAAANADWKSAPGFGISLNDQPGADSWPMTVPTFILVPKQPRDPAAAAAALRFFDWAYTEGDPLAEGLGYVPLPDALVSEIRAAWNGIVDAAGKPLLAAP